LAADLVVIRPGLLARRQLVEAAAGKRPTQPFADGCRSMPVSRLIVLAVPVLLAEEVEDIHARHPKGLSPSPRVSVCRRRAGAAAPRRRGRRATSRARPRSSRAR